MGPVTRIGAIARESRRDKRHVPQVDDLAYHPQPRWRWGCDGPSRPVPTSLKTLLLVSAEPHVEGLAGDPEGAAGPGDVASHILGVADHCQTVVDESLSVSLAVIVLLVESGEPEV